MENLYDKIIFLVKKIPKGAVATYGQIAALSGSPRAARAVGWALHQLPREKLETVPWQRVINREGRISTTCQDHTHSQQAELLKKEGVRVEYKNNEYFIDLKKYLWNTQSSPLKLRGDSGEL